MPQFFVANTTKTDDSIKEKIIIEKAIAKSDMGRFIVYRTTNNELEMVTEYEFRLKRNVAYVIYDTDKGYVLGYNTNAGYNIDDSNVSSCNETDKSIYGNKNSSLA